MRTPSPVNSSTLPPYARKTRGWVHWVTLLLLFGTGTAARFVCLGCKPLWFDEAFSVEVARLSWPNFAHLLWWREANMSLYYVLLRGWLHFGQSPYFIRSLSVAIGVLTLPLLYWLARMLFDRQVALIATALLTFNGYHVRYSQEARSYSLFVLLTAASSGLLVWWLAEPSRRSLRGYVATSVLAIYSHFYAILLIIAHWLGLRLPSPPQIADSASESHLRRAWWTIALLALPVVAFVAKTGAGPIRWIQRPSFKEFLAFFEHLCGSERWPLALIYLAACAVSLSSVGKRLWRRDPSRDVWRLQFLVIWLVFPIVLTVLLSFARPIFLPRYMIFCLPALVILAAAGLERLRRAWMLVAALAVMLLLSAQGIFFAYAHDFDQERDASVAASNFVLDHSQGGDAILFHIAEARIPYEFERSLRAREAKQAGGGGTELGPSIIFPRNAPGLDYRDFTGKPTADLLRQAAPSYSRLWVMLMYNGTPEKPDPTTMMLTQTLPDLFPKVQRWQFAKVEVRLYSR